MVWRQRVTWSVRLSQTDTTLGTRRFMMVRRKTASASTTSEQQGLVMLSTNDFGARGNSMATISSSAVIAVSVVLSQTCFASEITCPHAQQGARLKNVALFDGPPSELASLVPDSVFETEMDSRAEWDVSYIFQAGRHLYVRCEYGSTIPAVIIEPPASTGTCAFLSGRNGDVSLSCGAR